MNSAESADASFRVPNQVIAHQADQFFEASQVLDSHRGLLTPYLMNAAVAIELYIKSLSSREVYSYPEVRDDKPSFETVYEVTAKSLQKGHIFSRLFEFIPSFMRDVITERFERQHGVEFITELSRHDSLFMDSRYLFERDTRGWFDDDKGHKSTRLESLRRIVAFLHSFLHQLQSEFKMWIEVAPDTWVMPRFGLSGSAVNPEPPPPPSSPPA